MKKKKYKGIDELKNRYGYMFIAPWILGMALFFVIPMFQSVIYSFSSVKIVPDGVETTFVGLENYKKLLISDPNYMTWLRNSVTPIIYSLPIILLLSVVLAILLNQNFRGRLFFRSLYFLPVIIATGSVMKLLFMTTSDSITQVGVSDTLSENMIDVSDIIASLGLSGQVADYVNTVMGKIFDLLWSCGIQIVLFLAGLQSIPSSFYEVSKIEGATKWEEFWFITFPSLSRVTLLVALFTVIELITDQNSELVSQVYNGMRGAIYDSTSAMIWFYFAVCCVLMGTLLWAYRHFVMKRWE